MNAPVVSFPVSANGLSNLSLAKDFTPRREGVFRNSDSLMASRMLPKAMILFIHLHI
jgi:hypothetical protein